MFGLVCGVGAFPLALALVGGRRAIDKGSSAKLEVSAESVGDALRLLLGVFLGLPGVVGKVTLLGAVVYVGMGMLTASLVTLVGVELLDAVDPAGGISVFTPIGLFTLVVAAMVAHPRYATRGTRHASDASSVAALRDVWLGSAWLAILLPLVFAGLPWPSQESAFRAALHTLLAISGAVVSAAGVELLSTSPKIRMEPLLSAVVAGAVAIAPIVGHKLNIGLALVAGASGAVAGNLAQSGADSFFPRFFMWHDRTRIVGSLAVPGCVGALWSICVAWISLSADYLSQEAPFFFPHLKYQPLYQLAALAFAVGFALALGLTTGWILIMIPRPTKFFHDTPLIALPTNAVTSISPIDLPSILATDLPPIDASPEFSHHNVESPAPARPLDNAAGVRPITPPRPVRGWS